MVGNIGHLSVSGLTGGWNIFSFLVDLFNLIPKIVYYLCAAGLTILDAFQLVFRKLAGLDVYYVGDSTEAQTGDIALSFIRSIFETNSQYPAIKNAFWSLVVLGVILLIVTTIIATIRQEYQPGEEEAKEKPTNNKIFVIGRAIKSLFLFLIVPVSVVFGLALSDIFLAAIDSATQSREVGGVLLANNDIKEQLVGEEIYNGKIVSYTYFDLFGFDGVPATNTTTFSGMIFKIGAYSANRARLTDSYAVSEGMTTIEKTYYELIKDGDVSNFNIFDKEDTSEEVAQLIDDAFAGNVKLKNPAHLRVDGTADNFTSTIVFTFGSDVTHFSKFNIPLVWYYYNLWYFNYLVAFAALVISAKLLVKIIAGLAQRIIEMVALFIVSPPIVATMPLDGGKGFGEWRKNFLTKALSVYGAVVGMNLFFLILPYLNQIKLFSADAFGTYWGASSAIAMINLIVTTLFMITGLVVIESFIELLSGLIGAESAAKAGGEVVGKVGETTAHAAKYLGGAAGFATKAALAPIAMPLRAIGAATGATNKLKQTGKNLSNSIKRGVGYNKKTRAEAEAGAEKDWNDNKGAEQAYEQYASKNDDYNSSMSDAYSNRKGNPDMSFDKWKETKEGKTASNKSAAKAGLESLKDFKAAKAGSVGAEALSQFKTDTITNKLGSFSEALSFRTASVAKAHPNVGSAINVAKGVGLDAAELAKHASAYGSNVTALLQSSFERNNKQGLRSMILAFQGQSAKDIELSEIKAKIHDEESQKAIIQQEERKAMEEKQKKADEKQKDADKKQKETDARLGKVENKQKEDENKKDNK